MASALAFPSSSPSAGQLTCALHIDLLVRTNDGIGTVNISILGRENSGVKKLSTSHEVTPLDPGGSRI